MSSSKPRRVLFVFSALSNTVSRRPPTSTSMKVDSRLMPCDLPATSNWARASWTSSRCSVAVAATSFASRGALGRSGRRSGKANLAACSSFNPRTRTNSSRAAVVACCAEASWVVASA
ncbi:hypothetical protein D3C71_1751040 [compost metagenome]